MRKLSLALCSLIIVLIGSCYEPVGDNFENIPEPDLTGASIDIQNHGDTLYIDHDQLITFLYQGGKTRLQLFEVFINDELIYSTEPTYAPTFLFPAQTIGTGTHSMEIRVFAKTNSQSLADRLEREVVVFARRFVAIVDVEVPGPRTISLDTTQGNVRVDWTPYTKWNFIEYRLQKFCDASSFSPCKTIVFTDPSQISWVDTDYVGGWFRYRVDLKTSAHLIVGEEKYLNSKPRLAFELLPDKKMRVSWSKPTFYKNVAAIKIYQQGTEVGSTLLKTVQDFADTTLIANNHFRFGDVYESAFQVVIESKTAGVKATRTVSYAVGKLIDPSWFINMMYADYIENSQEYFIRTRRYEGNYLSVYDKDFTLLRERRYDGILNNFAISENGQWIYAYLGEGTQIESNKKYFIHKIDPQTLDTVRTFSIRKIFGSSNGLSNRIGVSNTNQLAYRYTNGQALSEMPSGRVLHWRMVFGSGVALSPDGKYFFTYNQFYQIDGDNLTLIGEIPPASEPDFIKFRDDVPNELMIMKSGRIRIVKVPELTERIVDVGSLAFPEKVTYDNGWLMYVTYSGPLKNVLINVNTGEQFIIPVTNDNVRLVLTNSKLFSSRGYVADLDLVRSLMK